MYRIKDSIYVRIEPKDPGSTAQPVIFPVEKIGGLQDYLGFSQDIEVESGEVRDYVIKQSVARNTMSLTVCFTPKKRNGRDYSAYSQMHDFMSMMGSYVSTDTFRTTLIIGMGDGTGTYDSPFSMDEAESDNNYGLRMDFAVSSIRPDGMMNASTCRCTMRIQALSAFYTRKRTDTFSKTEPGGKTFNYSYPYVYGGKASAGNQPISNTYLESIPVKLTLECTSGTLTDPVISLRRPGGTPYSRIVFTGLTLNKDERLIIDSDSFLVYKQTVSGGTTSNTNAINLVDKAYATFLWARTGANYISVAPSNTSAGDWKATTEWTQFQVC